MRLTKPDADQIEVVVFGPGYGECSVIHLGGDNWIVVDSCLNTQTEQPLSLEYFQEIGADPNNVRLLIATHWHDDHIRGMARQLRTFGKARFCTSPVLANSEFLATIVSYDKRHGIVAGSGASEICEVLEILQARSGETVPIRSAPARPIYVLNAEQSCHNCECTVVTLSPSDKQFHKFLLQLGALAPIEAMTKRRVPNLNPNDLSVVTAIVIGDQAILLGADLEESGDVELGWSAIVRLPARPKERACIFKIPHPGSNTARCPEVWQEMLVKHPLSILTPWNRKAGLPKEADIRRIRGLTSRGFVTSAHAGLAGRERPHSVQKQIRETVGRLIPAENQTGWVRLRNGGVRNPRMWCIELSEEACHLDHLHAA